ncbi:thiolase family protein [Desulfosporosinus sp. PR]|uniref:thiolase family protein n=1 Tax=Candidatus Desulfosporosinus nitrosoreducens TaxID=3401928 RepID=UPI0027F58EA9|nr:thiolase family protein [Desulfosporosinus sp. PR]MDQ7093225.1 thiolase family protein [Desulfosporosinus sp. PR]
MNREVVIVAAARTAIGDFQGALKKLTAVELGTISGKGALEKFKVDPGVIDEVVVAQTLQAGAKGNPARQIQNNCGIPMDQGAHAVTVNQQCASGIRVLEIACHDILLGKSEAAFVGGIESFSNAPYYLFKAREGYRMFHGNDGPWDAMIYDGLQCGIMGYHMGITAENLQKKYKISREEQDELAFISHTRAVKAIREGKFKEEIIPVEISSKKGTKIVADDEHPRADISREALAKMSPVFLKDGTVTAGNASGLNDGGAVLIIMSKEKAAGLGLKPLAKVVATANYGVDAGIMGIGPVYAIPRALKYAGLTQDQIGYFEINEAFAAQWLACNRELKIDMDMVNANGSGIGLGHPTGCTGVRLIVSLIYEMRRRQVQYGCASLCSGGGPAGAAIIELCD